MTDLNLEYYELNEDDVVATPLSSSSSSDKEDMVNHPSHYNAGGIECYDAIMAATNDLQEGYIQGNIIKYVWRYRYKNKLEDLKKARWYLDKLIDLQKNK